MNTELRLSAERLVDLLGSSWSMRGKGSLAEKLANALEDLISGGTIKADTTLPPERRLAKALALHRNTVSAAYGVLRYADPPWIESRQGSGHRVLRGLVGGPIGAARLASLDSLDREFVDISSGTLLPLEGVWDVYDHLKSDLEPYLQTTGYDARGIKPLRERIAEQYTLRGLPTGPEQILITSGSQQAVDLVTEAYVSWGARVVVEDPTYHGTLDVLSRLETKVLSVPMTPVGPDLRVLEGQLSSAVPPQMLYLLPTSQNPMGTTIPALQRDRMGRLLEQHPDLIVVADGSTLETSFDLETPPPLACYLPERQCLTIGSASKLYWGGLRVGWIRAHAEHIEGLLQLRLSKDLGTAIDGQLVVDRLMRDFEGHRVQRRAELRSGYELVAAALREHAPEWQYEHPAGGTTLWTRLPGVDVVALAGVAARDHNIKITAGVTQSPTAAHRDILRLPFGRNPQDVRHAIATLAPVTRTDPRVAAT